MILGEFIAEFLGEFLHDFFRDVSVNISSVSSRVFLINFSKIDTHVSTRIFYMDTSTNFSEDSYRDNSWESSRDSTRNFLLNSLRNLSRDFSGELSRFFLRKHDLCYNLLWGRLGEFLDKLLDFWLKRIRKETAQTKLRVAGFESHRSRTFLGWKFSLWPNLNLLPERRRIPKETLDNTHQDYLEESHINPG